MGTGMSGDMTRGGYLSPLKVAGVALVLWRSALHFPQKREAPMQVRYKQGTSRRSDGQAVLVITVLRIYLNQPRTLYTYTLCLVKLGGGAVITPVITCQGVQQL